MSISKCRAIGAALAIGAAGAAWADEPGMTIYGLVDTGLVTTTHTGDGSQRTTGFADSILGVSNVGFKGVRDIGGGTQAFFNLQAGFNPTSGQQNASGVLFSRNAYVGLQGPLGTVSVGKQWDLNDDWLVGSVFLGGYNSGAIFKFSEFDAVSDLYNSTIKYVTPAFGGAQAGALLALKGKAGDTKAGRILNVGGKYGDGPFYAGITYFHEDDLGDSEDGSSATYELTTAAAKYSLAQFAFRVGASFAKISGPGDFQSIASMSARKAQAYEVGVDYAFTDKIKGSADVLYRKNSTLENHTTGARLLGVYTLTSQASLLVNVAYLKNGGGATESLVNTDSGEIGGGYANQNQTSVALGVRYSF
jgi:predicted porin